MNFKTGIVPTTDEEREEMRLWFQENYDYFVKCHRRKECLHLTMVYDYNTGKISYNRGYRSKYRAYEAVSNAEGFIAHFYDDKLVTIQHRRFI